MVMGVRKVGYIFENCRLIPELSGGVGGEGLEVAVEGGKITRVGSAGGAEGERIDCGGMTLLPGLFDSHAHLSYDYYNGVIRLDDFKLLINSSLSAKRYLAMGFTTIRDMGAPKRLSVRVREAVERGLFVGPRIVSGGMILRPTASDRPADPNCFLRYVSGPEEYARAAREEIGGVADFVKLYAPGEPSELLPEEMEAAVRIAHRLGRRVAVHAHDPGAIDMCLEYGADTIEHASHIRPDQIERLRSGEQHIVPTLAVLSSDIPTPGFTKEQKERMLRPLLEANERNITAAYAAGLVMGFGTDCDSADLIKLPGLEFRMRREHCGMGNVDMLLQATKYSALICGLEGVTGEIKPGLDADLILVPGRPDEDISAMYALPKLVMARGRLADSL